MTWIGLPNCVYIKPLSDTEVYVISPLGMVGYRLVKHSTETSDVQLIGEYVDPHTAMYAAQKAEAQRVG